MSKNLFLSSRVCEINKKQDYSSLITIYFINYILRFSEQIPIPDPIPGLASISTSISSFLANSP
jgi:hypothetical protein